MSTMSYVFSCMFKNDSCDSCGRDCWLCPWYDEKEDPDSDYNRRRMLWGEDDE